MSRSPDQASPDTTDAHAASPQATWANSAARYGRVAMALHWLTALLILIAFPLGMIANAWPYETTAQFALKTNLFSIHKTLGIAAFFTALARILWALTQRRPVPLHPGRKAERFMAEAVHWSLYLAMLIVPLSGWVHHAATTGFAPILWPLGQGLPLVPQSPAFAEAAGAVHWLFTKILAASVLLHVGGALKHHLLDRDDTLRRMLPGRRVALPASAQAGGRTGHSGFAHAGALAAFVIAFLAIALAPVLPTRDAPAQAALAADDASVSDQAVSEGPSWRVEEGRLGFDVSQMGSTVSGSFADWSAGIIYDPQAPAAQRGSVEVTIAIDSLSLGSVTSQAKGADFLDAGNHPLSRFEAMIRETDDGYVADGVLSLAGAEVPVVLPFTLRQDGDRASAEGVVRVDRRDFGIGESHTDESAVGFGVDITFSLDAVRIR
jgi:cytochrome b561/polyisoprenoid-binding protein YceI